MALVSRAFAQLARLALPDWGVCEASVLPDDRHDRGSDCDLRWSMPVK